MEKKMIIMIPFTTTRNMESKKLRNVRHSNHLVFHSLLHAA